jgi:transcriptional regulator with XRE-family HTH domain
MSAPIDGLALRRELMRRGLEQRELAHRAGVSEGTLSRACRGRAIRASSFRCIALALAASPVVGGANELLEHAPLPTKAA